MVDAGKRAWVAFDTLSNLWTRDTYLLRQVVLGQPVDFCRGCQRELAFYGYSRDNALSRYLNKP